jgi:hypothetical protein
MGGRKNYFTIVCALHISATLTLPCLYLGCCGLQPESSQIQETQKMKGVSVWMLATSVHSQGRVFVCVLRQGLIL